MNHASSEATLVVSYLLCRCFGREADYTLAAEDADARQNHVVAFGAREKHFPTSSQADLLATREE